jgi:hypothetical protein
LSDALRKTRLLRAAVGLDGPVDPTAADWSEWVDLAKTERVLPQLYEVAQTSVTDLTAHQRAEAVAIQLDVASTMVRLEHALLEVAEVFDKGGIPYAVLKGTATAHLDHPDPSLRQFGDIDLLIDPADLGGARALLKSAGWSQAYRLPRYHEEFTHAVTFFASGLAELDLHQHIAHRALGLLVPTQELLADREPFDLAGRTLWALSRPDRLIHGAIHAVASRGPYQRLSSTADVLLLSRLVAPDAGALLARAERWRVRTIVERALRGAHDAAALPIPDAWKRPMAGVVHHRDRLVERAYLSTGRRPLTEELAYLRLLPSWRHRRRYLSGYLVIDQDPSGSGGVNLRDRVRYLWSRVSRGSA